MDLPCMNCGQSVDPQEAKIFASVFCCPACYLTAQRLVEKGERELMNLKIMLRESIRIALVNGKLHLGEVKVEDLSKKDVLEAILKLQASQESSKTPIGRIPADPLLPGSSKFSPKG